MPDADELAELVDDVRLLISDLDTANQLFTDDEIQRFLALRQHDPTLAAATALRAIAGNEAQLLKVMRLQDIQTDGAALSRELRQLADAFERQADEDEDLTIAEYSGGFAWRQRLFNERLRQLAEDG